LTLRRPAATVSAAARALEDTMQLPPVAVTTVGSFPRPAWLAERQRTEVRFLLDGEALREGVDDATRVVLQEQAELGVDLLTDGEQRRLHFIEYLLSQLDGFDLVDRRPKLIRRRKSGEWKVPRVADRIRWRAPVMVDDLQFARAHSSGPLKLALPGPMTIVDSTYDDA
jgi:5-methyltetrahydropteroyltriglutamate--homocysteine methyltransferase